MIFVLNARVLVLWHNIGALRIAFACAGQTVTATGTAGNFSLSLPSVTAGEESGWILADVVGGDVATDEEMKAAVEVIAGEARITLKALT